MDENRFEEVRSESDEHYEAARRRLWFIQKLRAAEIHWFFVQGIQAIEDRLYLPGAVSLLNGVEASVRVTMKQINGADLLEDSDLGATLGNKLLRHANEAGLPVGTLAFPGEDDFADKLKENQNHVEIVRLRHNLAHGNILEFVCRDLGPSDVFLTPDSLQELSDILLDICERWVEGLGDYRERELGL